MKHTLILFVALCVVTFAAVNSVNAHRDYLHQVSIKSAISAAQHARQAALEKAQAAVRAAQAQRHLRQLQDACEHGLEAYNRLAPAQQKNMVMPVCTIK
jgi:Tfp pilus assembly protein PilX